MLQRLFAPFPPDRVSWRVGSTNREKTKAMALAFIDARDVMERLDSVVGVAGWQCSYPHANGKTVCRIEIKIDGEWVGKEDGAGDTDVEAEKGALSDAFKRAAVRWGIGRYLYDLPCPWVEIEPIGKSYRIKDDQYRRLEDILKKDAKESAAPPAARPTLPPADDDPFTDTPSAPKVRLLEEWRKRIDGATDARLLLEWWNGAQRKKETQDFGLTGPEVIDVKNAVMQRRAEIEGRAAA